MRSLSGEVHARHAAPSTWHSNLAPGSEEKTSLTLCLVVRLAVLEMVVSGATVSTVKARVAAVASVLPAASLARTRKECAPSARLGVVNGLAQAENAPASTLHSNAAPGSLVNAN